MKPAQLRLLVEIANHGQLQIAAAAVSLSQPAASRMLAEIERGMQAELFERLPKGMQPTEVGHAVVRHARAILREFGAMSGEVEALKRGHAGSVRVGSVTGPSVAYLVPAVRRIKQTAPEAEIAIEVSPSRDLLRQLITGNLDFIIARLLPEFDTSDFDIQPLRDEQMALLVRAGHPLARSPAVTVTELSEQEWILQERGAPLREATGRAFADLGLPEPANVVISASLLVTIAYLSRSNAVAPMSLEVAELLVDTPAAGGFAILNQTRDRWVAPYYLIALKSRPMLPLASWLRDLVLEAVEAGPVPPSG